ncbi:unnamed protein product [Ceutorhynchus assimilis]|uniref:Envelope fusion protein n=1 Tax=Ceutorhynchus assimilis TaxID=467358 RepID=A0A9N9MWD2_9CUCU|nr:unnamed protein product [Ceutorhynchus assimilis]
MNLVSSHVFTEYLNTHKSKTQVLYDEITNKTQQSKEKLINKINEDKISQNLKVGCQVYKKSDNRAGKSKKKFLGPFTLTQILPNNKIEIENPKTKHKELGTAKIISNSWSFAQTFNLTPIINQFDSLKIQARRLSSNISSKDNFYIEYTNSLVSLHTLEKRIENLIEQIVPTVGNSNRIKRGLFNPLGSFIKVITGNLDQNGAEKIDEKIKLLQENQNKLKSDAINQITLMDSTIDKFDKMISNITHNELVLRSRILQIEQVIKDANLTQNIRGYFMTFTVINQITLMYQSIYSILDKLEVAISFSKLNTLHNSIVNPNELLSEIKNVESHLNPDRLPISPVPENILIFETFLQIKCFLKDFNVIFILELPLVEAGVYQYFNLHPLPIPTNHNQTFFVNIPHKPYLALSDVKYSYMDQRCEEISPDEYLCQKARTTFIENYLPCEVQLIKYSTNITSCHPFEVQLHAPQITKIIDGKWLVTVPIPLKSSTNCQNLKETVPIFGSYLLEVPVDCKAKIQSTTLESFKPSRLSFKEVNLPILDLSLINHNQSMPYDLPSLDLNIINVKTSKDIKEKLHEQKKKLEEITCFQLTREELHSHKLRVQQFVTLFSELVRPLHFLGTALSAKPIIININFT